MDLLIALLIAWLGLFLPFAFTLLVVYIIWAIQDRKKSKNQILFCQTIKKRNKKPSVL